MRRLLGKPGTLREFFDERSEEKIMEENNNSGWAISQSGAYTGIYKSCKTLPPSIYSIRENRMNGEVFFVDAKYPQDDYIELPDVVTQDIVEDIKKFWTSKKQYNDIGHTHKRGILLYGPPGGGKSTTIRCVIKDILDRGGIVFNFSTEFGVHLQIRGLKEFREIEPERLILVVLEDLEVLIRESYDEKVILSLLDGENQSENIAYISTTNYPEELPERIMKRPGRFDLVLNVGMPSAANRRKYLSEMVKKLDAASIKNEIDIDKWTADTKNLGIPHIKELIISVVIMGKDYDKMLKQVTEIKTKKRTSTEGAKNESSFGFK